MATKGEVRRGVEKYLRSKFSDYNNSVGQFDRVIMGVLSIMGSTLLQPDDPKFDHHIGLETERMLKKYGPGTDYYNERFGKKEKNNDSAMEYDPIACMMVPAKDQRTVDASTISETAKAYVKDAERLYNAAKKAKEDFFSTRDEYANRIRTYWVRNKQNMSPEEEEACKSAISKLNGMSYF